MRASLILKLSCLSAAALILNACTKGCSRDGSQPEEPQQIRQVAPDSNNPQVSDLASPVPDVTDLKIEDLEKGHGDKAEMGKFVRFHYSAWLASNGKKFDSSVERGEPRGVTLGTGRVVYGLEKGIEGMKVGGTRRIVVPPTMAYGKHGIGEVIPPNATLVYEVELVSVADKDPEAKAAKPSPAPSS